MTREDLEGWQSRRDEQLWTTPPPIGGGFRHRVVATLLESTGAGSLTGFGRDRSSRNRYRESQGALRARARVE